ncbi:MAG: hypothetical protein LC107_07930 [Chitinophagales bacterium]|nr:hypothetical protein [Chitinophagales bacterium]
MLPRFLFFILVLGLFSCNSDDKPGNINLRFHLVYDGAPMEMFKNYPYPGTDESFYFTRLSYYIADVNLKNAKEKIAIKDIDFLNLTATFTGSSPINGYEYTIGEIPVGDYTNLEFGIGVPKGMNAKSPAEYPAGTTLSSPTEYWESWKSYVFFKTEGSIVYNESAPDESDFALHLGGDEAYRTISLPRSITIESNKTTNVDITLDMKRYFDGITTYNIKDTPKIHSQSQLPLINQLMDNLVFAFQ